MLSDGCPEKHIEGWLVTLDCGAGSTPVGIYSQPVCGRKSKAEGGGGPSGKGFSASARRGESKERAVCLKKRGGSNLTNDEKDCQEDKLRSLQAGSDKSKGLTMKKKRAVDIFATELRSFRV